ncbi:MAG TPA: bifunctional shikimate kinase/3-dehydroquinate synthase [Candidatus Limnocylindrales bacterium]|jgi:3-dehydroquinate synthetase
MDVVLVGLPGSGKSVVGRRLAARHRATFVDLDASIEADTGRSIPDIFATDGEAAFRALERGAIADLGAADPGPEVVRIVATGGGAVIDPRNRWQLYRGRLAVWLDGRPEVLAQRLRRSIHVRPLVAGRDPIGAVRSLAAARQRFYAAAEPVNGLAPVAEVIDAVEDLIAERAKRPSGTVTLRASTELGELIVGTGIATAEIDRTLRRLQARRAILISEPGAWDAVGPQIDGGLEAMGWRVETVLLPRGEDAKRLAAIEAAAGELARVRVERTEPLVAIGGGALGDAAGFLSATWLRGVPLVHVPTTLVGQLDSAIGGKNAVDLGEGKNLVGTIHQPVAIVSDISLLATLPDAERRAALGEAVKMAALGDEQLFAVLETDGAAIANGDPAAIASGALAEIVERASWAKVEVVLADERETAAHGRITLNLGHSLGHAAEAAGGFRELRHGEAVAYGLRAACRLGIELGVTPASRAARIERLLDRLDLAMDPLPYPLARILDALATDKKHARGRLRWVLPTGDGVVVRSDVPADLVESVAAGLLVGATAEAGR